MYQFDPVEHWDLPETERALASVIGRAGAIRLSRRIYLSNRSPSRRGGNGRGRTGCLYVPAPERVNARFIEQVGSESEARAIADAFPGHILWLSGCRGMLVRLRANLICQHAKDGVAYKALAARTGLSLRQIVNICRGVNPPMFNTVPTHARRLRPGDAAILSFIRWSLEA